MSTRQRVLRYGAAAAVTAAGILCWILIEGLTGEVLAIALIGLGLGGALLHVFFEVGLSEDRALAEDERHRGASGR